MQLRTGGQPGSAVDSCRFGFSQAGAIYLQKPPRPEKDMACALDWMIRVTSLPWYARSMWKCGTAACDGFRPMGALLMSLAGLKVVAHVICRCNVKEVAICNTCVSIRLRWLNG